jgi:hypothetical protein
VATDAPILLIWIFIVLFLKARPAATRATLLRHLRFLGLDSGRKLLFGRRRTQSWRRRGLSGRSLRRLEGHFARRTFHLLAEQIIRHAKSART